MQMDKQNALLAEDALNPSQKVRERSWYRIWTADCVAIQVPGAVIGKEFPNISLLFSIVCDFGNVVPLLRREDLQRGKSVSQSG